MEPSKKKKEKCVWRWEGGILSSSFMRYIFIITESGENGTPQITVVRIVGLEAGCILIKIK